MAHFGGNEFTHFSVPVAFGGRYFILEPGTPPLVSVLLENEGKPVFEILKNNPVENPLTEVTTNPTGIVTVSEKSTGNFLYKVRPDSETSVVFGKLGGGEVPARITDRSIHVGGYTLENSRFTGNKAGVVVEPNGRVGIGAQIPALVLQWLSSQ